MTRAPGEVAFVLHTHLPWLKGHGVWPVGEEWLFQAWGTSWLPVTDMLRRLAADGHRDVLTLGVTPMVAAQVADPRLAEDLGTWLSVQMWRAEEQRQATYLDPPVRALSTFYWQHFARLVAIHDEVQAAGGLLAVWADLEARGVIELLGGPATHPYLPLVADPALLDAQLTSGLDHHAAWTGAHPTGIWSPECGYRPAGQVADPTADPDHVDSFGSPTLPRTGPVLPGLEDAYARHGIDHVLVDAATLVRAAGGAERDWTVRPEVPDPADDDPYEVVHDGVSIGDSDVVAFARDLSVAYHVWSPTAGYPGGVWYRDYYAAGSFGCHPSWRVTDKALGPMEKAPYEPGPAAAAAEEDAAHLHGVLREVLDPRPGALTVAAYDTELFGHWWFEGVAWLESTLRRVEADPMLRTTTLRSRLERRPATRRLELPESSWGYAKGHASWVTPQTRSMWVDLRAAEARCAEVLAGVTARTGPRAAARDQAWRELALAQASDWPFMVTRGNAEGYARQRLGGHLDRVHRLCNALAAAPEDGADDRRLDDLLAIAPSNTAPRDVRAFRRTTPSTAPTLAASRTSGHAAASMRILLLSWEYPPRVVGGLGRHVAALSRSLVALGHTVHVVTRDHPDAPAEEWLDDRLHVVRVSEPPPVIGFDQLIPWVLSFNAGVQTAATRVLLEHDIDVIHAHDWLVAYAAAGLKTAFDLPLTATVHATEFGRHQGHLPGPMNKLIHQVEWWLTYEARRVITCSRYMRDQVASIFELPRDKLDVIPNGVAVDDFRLPADEVTAFRAQLVPAGHAMVVFAGRLEYEKGIQTALHAMVRVLLEHGPTHFYVCGVGTYSDELRRVVAELDLGAWVHFTGFLEDHDLRLHYAAADVAVAPSIYEPFGLVAIEAMACGTPVIVGDTGGLREIVTSGDTGLRVPPEEPDALADAMLELLRDDVLAAGLVARATELIPDRYDWTVVGQRTVETYRRAIAEEATLQGQSDARPSLRSILTDSTLLDLGGAAG